MQCKGSCLYQLDKKENLAALSGVKVVKWKWMGGRKLRRRVWRVRVHSFREKCDKGRRLRMRLGAGDLI